MGCGARGHHRPHLAELAAALRIVEAREYGHILGIGDHQLELWAGEEQISPLEVFEWTDIRWSSVWRSDAMFTEPRRLEEWVRRHHALS